MLLDIGVFSAGVVESRIVAASRGHSSGMVMIRNISSTDGPAGAGGSGGGSGTPHAASSALTCLVKSRSSGFSAASSSRDVTIGVAGGVPIKDVTAVLRYGRRRTARLWQLRHEPSPAPSATPSSWVLGPGFCGQLSGTRGSCHAFGSRIGSEIERRVQDGR